MPQDFSPPAETMELLDAAPLPPDEGDEQEIGDVETRPRRLAIEASGLSLSDPATVPEQKPSGAEASDLISLAVKQFNDKNYAAAVDLLARAVVLDPHSPVAHNNLALALWRARQPARAEALARRAIALDRRYIPAHRVLSEVLREQNDIAAAIESYEELFAVDPNNGIGYNNFGLLLRKAKRFEEAQAAFARACELLPDEPSIRFNQLCVATDAPTLREAVACCRLSLARQPDSADTLMNLAVVLQLIGENDEAMAVSERAVALDRGHHQAFFNQSLMRLARGDYPRGFADYERRWELPELTKPSYRQPQWEGESLAGKTILLNHEQGLGDTVQFLRYVSLVAAKAARVVLRVDRPIVRLAASISKDIVISPPAARLPEFDVWAPLLSLPRIFRTQLDTIPDQVPYLSARTAVVERWKRKIDGLPGLKVGLAWAGNPDHINDFRRSIDFKLIAPVFEIPNVSLISLQVGARARDPEINGVRMFEASGELTDLAETAGVIANLDLVIGVDTSVVHVAGAVAKPVWALLPFSPDWRWMLNRDDSPWYPTMRLYRQTKPGDWTDVISRVVADLREKAAHFRNGKDGTV